MRKKKNAKKRVTEEIKIVVRSLKQRLMAVFLLFLMQVQLFAGIVPDPITIGTRVTTTSTGIDQVDIARPNANGTSYNAYKEFDVNNRIDGANRDTERFIRGSDGSVYYTNDHYTTIFKIK